MVGCRGSGVGGRGSGVAGVVGRVEAERQGGSCGMWLAGLDGGQAAINVESLAGDPGVLG
ncbi:MAG: hypothetical protein RI897_634 [Verrucomicrobiota bacterium]